MEIAGIHMLTFVGFILTIVALVIDLIGFAAPYWWYIESLNTKRYAGLWKLCFDSGSSTTCGDFVDSDNLQSWFEAVQAMETIGFLCLIAALVVVILKLFVLKDKPILKWVAVGCLAAAAAFILIGVCIYGGEASTLETDNLHFAFAFVIIAAIIAIVASIMFCLDK
ncbi:uncharacterized protein LOC127728161 [Mytilus californianus]|uniref:uncharacterized protein LOC127728161 n=1 Tax=Mytilus californianus TaxID=6549 RepID=UPI002245DA00|nr:uncharacterized protein LOC127728161 [Mytilus californianus]